MPSHSGLLDEAVEAMARAMYVGLPRTFDALPDSIQRTALGAAGRLLAALPAGVYRSDGQGHVTYRTEDETARAMAARLADIPILRRGDFTDHGLVRLLLAALSATDTDKAGDGTE